MKPKILFILKNRDSDFDPTPDAKGWRNRKYTGLFNSVSYITSMLDQMGIESKMVIVQDNNKIDFEVAHYRPTHVIIEAFWVVPSKFAVLSALHKDVKWIVRIHSEVPFLAQEGVGMEWIFDYLKHPKVMVAANSRRIRHALEVLTGAKIPRLANYYPLDQDFTRKPISDHSEINIGCFGAIRPLKNHLSQAFAAIEFANFLGRTLNFHINADRIEMQGRPILKNIKALFDNVPHNLIEHQWMDTPAFLKLAGEMDMGMQCSFSETFNIVAADFVVQNIPVVVSKEIPWARGLFMADPSEPKDILRCLKTAWFGQIFNLQKLNYLGLDRWNKKAILDWKEYFSY